MTWPIRFLLLWTVVGSEPVGCPSPPPDPYTGQTSNYSTLVQCWNDYKKPMRREFDSLWGAGLFVKKAPKYHDWDVTSFWTPMVYDFRLRLK